LLSRLLSVRLALVALAGALVLACVGGGGPLPDQGDGRGTGEKPGTTAEPANPSGEPPSTTEEPSAPPDAGAGSRECTPGSFVFCRCRQAEEGTKQCDSTGSAFGPCVCADAG
jgi:hypothetical protein